MLVEEIQDELFRLRDEKYRDFQVKLIPAIDSDRVIGVRTPHLRQYARQLAERDDISDFLNNLPHRYFEECQLHAFIISGMKDYDRCMEEVDRFLPSVDNWATCDQLSPKIFKKHKKGLLDHIRVWIQSEDAYTVRFAIGMLMEHFLDDGFHAEFPEMVARVRSDEYYVNMMIAWYFATALAKRYEAVLPYIERRRLDRWTHNKAIQKSVESRRITLEQKEYLKSLKVKKQDEAPARVHGQAAEATLSRTV